MIYSSKLGHFSVVKRMIAQAKFKVLHNLEKVNGINRLPEPLDCSFTPRTLEMNFTVSVDPLVEYLQSKLPIEKDDQEVLIPMNGNSKKSNKKAKKPVRQSQPQKTRIICRASVLHKMMMTQYDDNEEKCCTFEKISGKTHITIEEVLRETDRTTANNRGFVFDKKTVKLIGDVGAFSERSIEDDSLYVMVEHTFRDLKNTTLYVSKEIDAEQSRKKVENVNFIDMTSLDLKAISSYKYFSLDHIEYYLRKEIVMSYLANGITYVFGCFSGENKNKATKVTFMENICSFREYKELEEFKVLLVKFLEKLCNSKVQKGMIVRTGGTDQKIYFADADGGNRTLFGNATKRPDKEPWGNHCERTCSQYDQKTKTHAPGRHTLIVLGCNPPVYNSHWCSSDIITLESFLTDFYWEHQCRPKRIIVYGDEDDCQKVKEHRLTLMTIFVSVVLNPVEKPTGKNA